MLLLQLCEKQSLPECIDNLEKQDKAEARYILMSAFGTWLACMIWFVLAIILGLRVSLTVLLLLSCVSLSPPSSVLHDFVSTPCTTANAVALSPPPSPAFQLRQAMKNNARTGNFEFDNPVIT